MVNADIKAKLRRAAAYLQGEDTAYFSDRGKLEAVRLLYRIADIFSNDEGIKK